MTINPLTSATSSYFDSIAGNTPGTSQSSNTSTSQPQDSTAQISPAASFLSQIHGLQACDPNQFQQVTSSISTQLRQAAQTATGNGNSTEATQLNNLADQFQSASTSGTMPNLQGQHHHHHHGHHGGYGSSGIQNQTDTQSLLNSVLGSTSGSTSGSANGSTSGASSGSLISSLQV